MSKQNPTLLNRPKWFTGIKTSYPGIPFPDHPPADSVGRNVMRQAVMKSYYEESLRVCRESSVEELLTSEDDFERFVGGLRHQLEWYKNRYEELQQRTIRYRLMHHRLYRLVMRLRDFFRN